MSRFSNSHSNLPYVGLRLVTSKNETFHRIVQRLEEGNDVTACVDSPDTIRHQRIAADREQSLFLNKSLIEQNKPESYFKI